MFPSLFAVVLLAIIKAVPISGEECTTSVGVVIHGQSCVLLSKCPILMEEAKKRNHNALRTADCGFNNFEPRGAIMRDDRVRCETRAGVVIPGQTCVLLTQCPELIDAAKKGNVKLLRDATCDYKDYDPLVCCDSSPGKVNLNVSLVPTLDEDRAFIKDTVVTEDPIVTTATPISPILGAVSNSCYTPDNQIGTCTSIFQCPALSQFLSADDMEEWILEYIFSATCEDGKTYCCAKTPPVKTEPASSCTSTALLPNPPSLCCGIDASTGTRILGGNATDIKEYPWLVLIEYEEGDESHLRCGGVLISGLYALTAAHCYRPSAVRIRLGEYNITNTGKDCVPILFGEYDCTDDIVIIPIEEFIVHPNYNHKYGNKRDDIALIRLKTLAPYTDFIRPICLPMYDITLKPPSKFELFAAGWGQVNETISASDIKQDINIPFVPQQKCQQSYNKMQRKRLQLWSGQMCAGGVKGKDTCKGDSGGPLVYDNYKKAQDYKVFEVLGIISRGYYLCGVDDTPSIYTKVANYIRWIRSNVRP